MFKFPWNLGNLEESSIDVDRPKIGRTSLTSCASSWKFVILVQVGENV